MTLGTFIKKIRKEKKLTQQEVAITAGLARSYISRLEDDNFKSPSAMVLIKLAKGLGISHESILQVAGYTPKIENTSLPPLDVYLRTKYPGLSEQAIKELEFFKKFIEDKYAKDK